MPTVTVREDPARLSARGIGGFQYALVRLVPSAVVVWALLCGIGYLLTRPLRRTLFERWDESVVRFFADHRTAPWDTVTHGMTFAAETYTVMAIGLVFFVGMRVRLHRWRESMFLLAAVLGEVTIFVCSTMVIDRSRPPVPHLDDAPPTSSFPSGHTAAAVTLYGALALIALSASRRPWLRGLAVTVAVAAPICVGLARLYRGMHYPTDVLAGALLGMLWLTISAIVVLRRPRQ
ncbi:MAG TPA: phosphatase PAP2 family protein [Jatrophihabitantaceae bacterium]|nr:phosphatase PAP2 family protein [Jatrophihabitantaceae bacterium]